MSPDKKVIRKLNKTDLKSDFSFWKTQSYEQRLKALEEIRQEYIEWKYDNKQRFQRVYSIHKKNKKATGRHQDLADIENLE
ncbi:MAG: hypothetical protein KAT38_09980 [Bacteroidales bacterium]|nr:hypothetical protein [Bacteroidales bacterium]